MYITCTLYSSSIVQDYAAQAGPEKRCQVVQFHVVVSYSLRAAAGESGILCRDGRDSLSRLTKNPNEQ